MRAVLGVLLLVLLAGAIAPPVGGQADESPVDWRTLTLEEGEIDATAMMLQSPDLGSVLAHEADRMGLELRTESIRERTDAAPDDSARFDIYEDELATTAATIATLQERDARTAAAFTSGSVDASELIRETSRTGAYARAIDDRLSFIRIGGQEIESRAIVAQSESHSTRAATVDGAVRDQVAAVQRGTSDPAPVYVEAAGNGTAFATMGDDAYYREVTVPGRRSDEGTIMNLATAIDVVADAYPGAYADRSHIEASGDQAAEVYQVTLAGGDGSRITAFVDARSRQIFKESRTRPHGTLFAQLEEGATASDGDFRLTTSRTYRGGPLLVRTRNETGTAIDARIKIGGQSVGRTGTTGRFWTVAPSGPVNVTAFTTDHEATVEFTPEPPLALNETG